MPVGEDTPVQESAVEAQDDMDKAETFGFGYHKVIHLVCAFALIAVVASMPNPARPMIPMRPIVKRETIAPEAAVPVGKDASAQESAVEAQDDLEKAETFGFGYHKVIHVGVPVYPAFYHYPLYYPGYHGYGMAKQETELLCVCACILVAVAALPSAIEEPVRQDGIVKRDTVAAAPMQEEDAPAVESAVEAQDDMDRAETFGFGYRKYIHIYPRYYPRFYYGGYYPRYYYGHYGHYW
uniref:Uncharacterized protein n=1 Tax=Anopheles epiroticus TaxID=199890 RepID=A0A182P125_9DIPT